MASSEIPTLPPISTIPSAPEKTRHSVLALLFEPSPSLYVKADPLLVTTSFETYNELIRAIGTELQCLAASDDPKDLESLTDILASHPRLGDKKVESAMSRMEQAAMQNASVAHSAESGSTNSDLEEEQATLKVLNRLYEASFPGMRYVVFVNGRPRPVIFDDMKTRIARGDIKAERLEAIQAMCYIAADRVKKLEAHHSA